VRVWLQPTDTEECLRGDQTLHHSQVLRVVSGERDGGRRASGCGQYRLRKASWGALCESFFSGEKAGGVRPWLRAIQAEEGLLGGVV